MEYLTKLVVRHKKRGERPQGEVTGTCALTVLEVVPSEEESEETAPPPPPALLCTPGETRECVGAAACKGGQACLSDGSGYGTCDCGEASEEASSDTDGAEDTDQDAAEQKE